MHGGIGDDGLIQRFNLMVWPDQSPFWENVDRPQNEAARHHADETLSRLATLSSQGSMYAFDAKNHRMFLRFDDQAQERFNSWLEAHEKKLRSGEWMPALESHFAKYRSLIPSLALIYHLCDSALTPAVNHQAIDRALAFAAYLETHAIRTYNAALNSNHDTARITPVRQF